VKRKNARRRFEKKKKGENGARGFQERRPYKGNWSESKRSRGREVVRKRGKNLCV